MFACLDACEPDILTLLDEDEMRLVILPPACLHDH